MASIKPGALHGSNASWFSSTAGIIPLVGLAFFGLAWSVQQGGEIKSGKSLRAQMFQMPGALALSVVIAVALGWLLVSRLGAEFITSVGYLYSVTPDKYNLALSPLFGTFVALLGHSSLLVILTALMFSAWFWMFIPNAFLGASRVILASSVDRILPEWIGKVSQRTFTPVRAILCVSALGLVMGLLVAYSTFSTYLVALVVTMVVCFGATCFAGAIMPWRRPLLFKDSPGAKLKVLGIPLITISGMIFFVFAAWVAFVLLTDDRYGMSKFGPLTFIGGMYVVSVVIFFVAKLVRLKEGIDVNRAYEQIPIE